MKSASGKFLTKALFWETSSPTTRKTYPPLYTLKENDHEAPDGNTYPSAYKIYIESIDEFDAAQKLLGSTLHWEALCRCTWFMDGYHRGEIKLTMGLKDWRNHKDMADKSAAKQQLLQAAAEGNVSAQRLLYGTPPAKKAGRKSKPVIDNDKFNSDDNITSFLDSVGAGDG